MKIVFATNNVHKVEEVGAILTNQEIQLLTLRDIGFDKDIVEDGDTIAENAIIKARHIYKLRGGHVVADDTGLEVAILNGAPGVHSARYAGPQRDADDNMDKLLEQLKNKTDRTAQFKTVVAAIINDNLFTFEGIIKGRISTERLGTGGFGYDPIFVPDGYDLSFGQLAVDVKNEISHRARAFMAFAKFLNELKS